MILFIEVKCDSFRLARYVAHVLRDIRTTHSEIKETPYHTSIKLFLNMLSRFVLVMLSNGTHRCSEVLNKL